MCNDTHLQGSAKLDTFPFLHFIKEKKNTNWAPETFSLRKNKYVLQLELY